MTGASEICNSFEGKKHAGPDLRSLSRTLLEGVNNHLPDALVLDTDTLHPRLREKVIHRQMANMCVAGFNNVEIGKAFDYTPAGVAEVLKTPFIREYMLRESREAADDFRATIIMEGKKAFDRAVAISADAKSEAVRLDANKYIINRWLGMPTQPVEQVGKPAERKTDDELLKDLSGVLGERAGVLSN